LDDCVGHGKFFGKRNERMPQADKAVHKNIEFFSLATATS
jgi:hypothetical protein